MQIPEDRGVFAVDFEACRAPCGRGHSGSLRKLASEPLSKRARKRHASSMPTFSTLPVRLCLRSLMKVSVIAVTLSMPPLSHMAVSMQWASRSPVTPLPATLDVEPPKARAALRQVLGNRPVLQELRAVVEDLAELAFVDELLGQRDRRHAAIVVPDHVRHFGLLDRLDHLLRLRRRSASGFSHMIILPASAAAMAISACVLLGVAMSITSMSLRATSLRQSVSMDS